MEYLTLEQLACLLHLIKNAIQSEFWLSCGNLEKLVIYKEPRTDLARDAVPKCLNY